MKKKNTKSSKSVISPEIRAVLNEYKEDIKRYVDILAKSLSKTLSEDFQRERKSLSEDFQRERKSLSEDFQRERKTLSEDVQRHMGALSEDFQSKVAVVAEQVIGTNDKVDKQGEKLDEVIRIQNTHTNMIGAMMEDISEIKEELKNKADKIEVVRLDCRVRVLEHVA